jgi:hydroxypyruvate isomerase
MNRRMVIGSLMAAGALAAGGAAVGREPLPPLLGSPVPPHRLVVPLRPPVKLKGHLKQGLTRMVLGASLSVEQCCEVAVSLGATGLDFFSNPADWPTLKRYGLICSMLRPDYGGGASLIRPPPGPAGWNAIGSKAAMGEFLAGYHKTIDLAADNGLPNIILLAGTRGGGSYEDGAQNAIDFCNQVKAHAEQRGVTLCMELINSTGFGGPPGSLFDHFRWGLDIVKKVDSPRVRILYDAFHAQMMDGNIVRTIAESIDWIGHFHVGGVPGRNELDETQELNYRLVAKTISDLGFAGFVTHEWVPSERLEPIQAIRKSMQILDV